MSLNYSNKHLYAKLLTLTATTQLSYGLLTKLDFTSLPPDNPSSHPHLSQEYGL